MSELLSNEAASTSAMASQNYEVVRTRAGEHSILDRRSGEVMHPVGRIEAETLYVAPSRLAARLVHPPLLARAPEDALRPEPLVLLDVGLGAASNASAAFRVAEQLEKPARRLEIVSIDHSLEPLALALSPEHRTAFGLDGQAGQAACALLERPDSVYESATVRWRVCVSDLTHALAGQPDDSVDVVFWDMYSPRTLPELWTVDTFVSLRRACRRGATLHTYSGALGVRAALLLAGFAVGLGPSSGGKQRHTTIAAVDLTDLERPLDRAWLERLLVGRDSGQLALSDQALERLRALRQFSG